MTVKYLIHLQTDLTFDDGEVTPYGMEIVVRAESEDEARTKAMSTPDWAAMPDPKRIAHVEAMPDDDLSEMIALIFEAHDDPTLEPAAEEMMEKFFGTGWLEAP